MEVHVRRVPTFSRVFVRLRADRGGLHCVGLPNVSILCLSYLHGNHAIGSMLCMKISKRRQMVLSHGSRPPRPSWDIVGHGLRHPVGESTPNQSMGPDHSLPTPKVCARAHHSLTVSWPTCFRVHCASTSAYNFVCKCTLSHIV